MFKKKTIEPEVNEELVRLYSDKNIEQALLNKDTISPLETLLEQKQEEFIQLQDLKLRKELDFGPEAKVVDLETLSQGVKEDVDLFLGVSGIDECDWKVSTAFNDSFRRAIVAPLFLAGAIFVPVVGLDILYLLSPPPAEMRAETASFLKEHTLLWGGFLGLHSIAYTSLFKKMCRYEVKQKRVYLGSHPEATLAPLAGHEYDHHLLSELGVPYKVFSKKESKAVLFHEGHA